MGRHGQILFVSAPTAARHDRVRQRPVMRSTMSMEATLSALETSLALRWPDLQVSSVTSPSALTCPLCALS
jgi:hypothetical protein